MHEQEDAAKKVERQVAKSAAAMLLQSKIGQRFDAIVTGASEKGRGSGFSFPRLKVSWFRVPGCQGRQQIQVQLLHTDVERGFIDFEKVG